MRFKEMNVTPKLAAKWLELNESNRGVSDRRVDAYARDMVAGNWFAAPHGLVFNAKGALLDGQHRLYAVIKADKPVRMVVVSGVDHEVRKFIDKGRPRSIADVLKMHGQKYYMHKASAARWLRLLDGGDTSVRDTITASETEVVLDKYRAEVLWLDSTVLATGFCRAPYLAAVMWALRIAPEVEAFHERVQTGLDLKSGDPASILRAWFIRSSRAGAVGSSTIAEECVLRSLNCIHSAVTGKPMANVYASAVGYRALAEMRGSKGGKLATRKAR